MCAVSLRYIKAMTNNSIFVNPHLPVFASIVRFGITLLKTRNKYSFTLDYITFDSSEFGIVLSTENLRTGAVMWLKGLC